MYIQKMSEYIIGGSRLQVNRNGFPLKEDSFFSRFRAPEGSAHGDKPIVYEFFPCALEAYSEAPLITYNSTFELRQTSSGPLFICHWATWRFAYGLWLQELLEGDSVRCYYSPTMGEQDLPTMTRFFSTMGLHSKLLQRGTMVLHGAFVEIDGSAVIFVGASGAGKSTQASLWESCGKGRIINGDRVLLRQMGGRWYAFGYPCCGSSSICLNETLPLKAIVFLQKSKENRVLPVSPSMGLRGLLLGTQIFSWIQEEQELAYKLAKDVCERVPMVTLSATRDIRAVSTLEQYLTGI